MEIVVQIINARVPLELFFRIRRFDAKFLAPLLKPGIVKAIHGVDRRKIEILKQILPPIPMRRDGRDLE